MLATLPAIEHVGSAYLSGGAPGHGEAAAGDHLQTSYHLWLFGNQLEHGRAPWLDPYSFYPEAKSVVNPAVWPFGLPYWGLDALFGDVLGWNLFVLLTLAAGGLVALAWLRELGLPRGPALAGGLAFAIAPYRVEQTVGHLLGPISILLPLSLFAFERARRHSRWWLVGSGAALASIPLSGQVHLALGAIPFALIYAVCRTRDRWLLAGTGAGVAAAIGAGILIHETTIVGSVDAGGRSLAQVAGYSATGLDLVTRHERHGPESFVFLGWATPVFALVGLALLLRARRFGLAIALTVGASVPIVLSLGTNLPFYSTLWRHLPPLRYPRVPERLMPIACVALAALVAFAVAELVRLGPVWRELAVALAVGAVLLDLHVTLFGSSAADTGNKAYAALRTTPPGQLLELPVFLPDVHLGSVYLAYDRQLQWRRPGGYSTTAPVAADVTARRLRRLNCGDWSGETSLLNGLGVHAIALHEGLYRNPPIVRDPPWFAWRALLANGWRPLAHDGAVTSFVRGTGPAPANPLAEPPHVDPVYCEGWYPADGYGRLMSLGHAPVWVFGRGTVRLFVQAHPRVRMRISVDGRFQKERAIRNTKVITLSLGRAGWHLIAFDGHLARYKHRLQGARLISFAQA